MRPILALFSSLGLVVAACSDPAASPSSPSPSPSPSASVDAQVSELQSRMAQGTWTGQAANDACAVYVKQAASPSGRELTVDVSLDKENMLNGVVRSADDRIVSARFYINTAGSTLTRSFAVTADAVDVDVDDQSAEPGRSAHLRAALTSNGFSFVEVESTRDGATHTKRCENVGKKR